MVESPSDLVGKEFIFETGGVFATDQMAFRRERVVRCRDCAYASPCPLADSEKLICAFHDETFVNPDGFCAWGEERDA